MSRTKLPQTDPKLDLVLTRIIDVPVELVWRAWTTPEHLKKWFTPVPWKTVDCEIDLRPGGMFRTVMESPEGQRFPTVGCYLEVVENERLTWTNVLQPGFRPATVAAEGKAECDELPFTAIIALEPHGDGTKYTAFAMHRDEAGRQAHEKMGFHEGWGKALDQLVELAESMRAPAKV